MPTTNPPRSLPRRLPAANRPRRALPAALTLATLLAFAMAPGAARADTQTWVYKSYKKGGQGGTYSAENFNVGSLSLDERDGRATVRIVAGALDACLRGSVPADVTRAADTVIIELKPTVAGCEEVRYVIRTDGSGGRREHKRGERWADDRFDHGLTPVAP